MNRFLIVFVFLAAATLGKANEYDEVIQGGRSPDREIEVVNIHNGEGGYFVIRNSSGETIFSEKSLGDEFGGLAHFAWKVLWRPDSRLVAIAFGTSKFSVETVVFYYDGKALKRVELPVYDPESGNTHRVPHCWLKNGDLVLDITEGYHTKSDGGISGYFATVHFTGNPPKATKGSETKSKNRD